MRHVGARALRWASVPRLPRFSRSLRLPRLARLPLRAAIAAAAILAFLPSARSLAAPFDPVGQDWEGLSQLIHLAQSELGASRVVLPPALPLGELKREDGVFLVHPERALDLDEVTAFMRAGGRIVLLDDYGTGTGLLTRFGIRRVSLPVHPTEALRGNAALAIARQASLHPIVRELGRVVTNHATGLEQPALSPLLVVHGAGEPDVVVALAGVVGQGRLVAIGDASIPMNAMMRYPGNRVLSRELVRYAVEDDAWGKRGGKLYVLANGFGTSGTFGSSSRTSGAASELRRAIVDAIGGLREGGLPPTAAYAAALAIGLGIVVWTSVRVGRTHKPVVPRFTRAVPAAAQGGIAGHAAVLGSPQASRVLGVLELKSALEEQLATTLGLTRAPPPDELVEKVRTSRVLDEPHADALAQLLGELAGIESAFARLSRPTLPGTRPNARVGNARVLAYAARVHALLGAIRPRGETRDGA
jgi:hypothetical protein